MLREGTFSTGTVDLHHVSTAEDGPPLVFLHGITSRRQSSPNVMPAFAPRWQLHALDFRGHGIADRRPAEYR